MKTSIRVPISDKHKRKNYTPQPKVFIFCVYLSDRVEKSYSQLRDNIYDYSGSAIVTEHENRAT